MAVTLYLFKLQLTDDVKREKEKEPEKVEKVEPAVPRKRFEEELMDSDSDSDDEVGNQHVYVSLIIVCYKGLLCVFFVLNFCDSKSVCFSCLTVSFTFSYSVILVFSPNLLQYKKLDAAKLSKKKLRRMNRFTVAELKQVII